MSRESTTAAIPTRYSLLSRLQNWQDSESWQVFFDTYWRLIYKMAIRSGLTETEAQEVVQETVICVAKNIQKFQRDRQRGSFKGWLRNITRWRIADQLRKRTRRPSDKPATPDDPFVIPNDAADEPDADWDLEWKATLFKAAVERAKRHVKEEHFQIFELHVLREWPVDKVAKTLGVSAARIYLVKHRVTAIVKKEIRALEKGQHLAPAQKS